MPSSQDDALQSASRPSGIFLNAAEASQIRAQSASWPSWDLTPRQLAHLELLGTGALAPLDGYLTPDRRNELRSSLALPENAFWPATVVLDVAESFVKGIAPGGTLALRDPEGLLLAALRVESIVPLSLPGRLPFSIAGRLDVVQLPTHYDFRDLRHSPVALRSEMARRGWSRALAVPVAGPLLRADLEAALSAAKRVADGILFLALAGSGPHGELRHFGFVRAVKAAVRSLSGDGALLSLLPLSPEELPLLPIVARNCGATHLVSGPAPIPNHLGLTPVELPKLRWLASRSAYVPQEQVPAREAALDPEQELSRRLEGKDPLPDWIVPPGVEAELRRFRPTPAARGFAVFLTGLSGAGKSTIANVLRIKLLERGKPEVTLLDGDIVRKHLSSELGFSREHRDLNIRRIGFVASEIVRHRGVVICAPIAPFDGARKEVRALVEPHGGFILIHVSAPLEVCERRDRKGLYAKARAGLIKGFTGVSDPYEAPQDAEIVLQTAASSPEEEAGRILAYLEEKGYLEASPGSP